MTDLLVKVGFQRSYCIRKLPYMVFVLVRRWGFQKICIVFHWTEDSENCLSARWVCEADRASLKMHLTRQSAKLPFLNLFQFQVVKFQLLIVKLQTLFQALMPSQLSSFS